MIVDRIKHLCFHAGTSIPKLEQELGFGRGSIYNWDSNSPSVNKIVAVASHFNVSVDSLLGVNVAKSIDAGLHAALDSVITERARQDAKWGQQNHEPHYWTGILVEEVGELCEAINETVFNNGPTERLKGGYANMRKEAVEVAAVAVAFVEMLDRRYKP